MRPGGKMVGGGYRAVWSPGALLFVCGTPTVRQARAAGQGAPFSGLRFRGEKPTPHGAWRSGGHEKAPRGSGRRG
jgi:hypothetical protein